MCCHQHPDNGRGLALEKTDPLPVSPWTLKELEELEASMDRTSWYAEQDVHLDCLRNFLHWLGGQGV